MVITASVAVRAALCAWHDVKLIRCIGRKRAVNVVVDDYPRVLCAWIELAAQRRVAPQVNRVAILHGKQGQHGRSKITVRFWAHLTLC